MRFHGARARFGATYCAARVAIKQKSFEEARSSSSVSDGELHRKPCVQRCVVPSHGDLQCNDSKTGRAAVSTEAKLQDPGEVLVKQRVCAMPVHVMGCLQIISRISVAAKR